VRGPLRYLPLLLFVIMLVFAFLHGLYLVNLGQLNVGQLVAYVGLLGRAQRAPSPRSTVVYPPRQGNAVPASERVDLQRSAN